MPSSAILELVARGVQDIYLIGNPQITFFKSVFKRFTNFSIESVQTNMDGDPDFGNKITITIPRKGDLLSGMMLEFDLPSLSTSTTFSGSSSIATGSVKYVDNIGHALIEYADIKIGGTLIDRHYGEWMDIWTELTDNTSQKEGLDIMLGRTGELSNTSGGTVYIPMRYWFCRNIGLALPLIALQYHDVDFEVKLRPLASVTTLGEFAYYTATGTSGSTSLNLVKPDTENTPNLDTDVQGKIIVTSDGTEYFVSQSSTVSGIGTSASPYVITLNSALSSSLSSDEIYIKPNGELASTPSITDTRLFLDYVYLDTYEKKEFALAKHRYLIEQVQYSGEEGLASGIINKKQKLNFNLPIKELFWTIQLTSTSRNNDLFNYSNTVAEGIVQGNLMNKCTILYNGLERFDERNADYFRIVQPYQYHTRVPNKYFYIYSFSINPEEFQPSGCSNFSKIDVVDLDLTMVSGNPATNLKVYALNYNILRIFNGMGGVVFTN